MLSKSKRQTGAILQQQPPRRGDDDIAGGGDDVDGDDRYNDPEPTDQEYEENRAEWLRLYNGGAAAPSAATGGADATSAQSAVVSPAQRALAALVAFAAGAGAGAAGTAPLPPAAGPGSALTRDETQAARARLRLVQAEAMLRVATEAPAAAGLLRFLWTAAAVPPWPRRCGNTPVDLHGIRLLMDTQLAATLVGLVVPCDGVLAAVGQFLFEGAQAALVLVFRGDTRALLVGGGAASAAAAGTGQAVAPAAAAEPLRFPATRDWAVLSDADKALAHWRYVGHGFVAGAVIEAILYRPALRPGK